MRRLLFLIFISLITTSIQAQHITYADLMKIVKIEQWSSLNDVLNAKGYKFAGSRNKYENTDSAYTEAVWCKNCTYDFYTGDYTWDTGVSRSLLFVYRYTNRTKFEIIFTGKQAYDTFLNTAKANGFKYNKEQILSDCISIWYLRVNYQKHKAEAMKFNQFTDAYSMIYYGELDFVEEKVE